jgi:hypothetical protein
MRIWWTNQEDCEAIGEELPEQVPEYIREQYQSRSGRNGRGRLWVSAHLGNVSIQWPEYENALEERLASDYAGIVINDEDVIWIVYFPGIVTNLSLKPIWIKD